MIGSTEGRAGRIYAEGSSCRLCPRQCGADRGRGQRGFCGAADKLLVARAALHFWEEPCLSGTGGSGAVFFSGCALRCVYCQNHAISHGGKGQEIDVGELADCFLRLEAQGAENINLVTPDHFLPQVRLAMEQAREAGFRLPFVVNCSGYETEAQIRMLEGLADIYLMDFKYIDGEKAARYSGAGDYPAQAKESLREMVRQQPRPVLDARGMLRRGVLVRHLLLPGMVRDARAIVQYVHQEYGDRVLLSLLRQYTPMGDLSNYPELCRKVTKREYERLLSYVLDLDIQRAYIQEGGSVGEDFVPPWDGTGLGPHGTPCDPRT